MAIPIIYFTSEQLEGVNWRVNFCRHEKDASGNFRQWSCWSLTTDTFHSPTEFGRLTGTAGLTPKPVFMPVLYGARTGVVSALGGDSEYTMSLFMRSDKPGTRMNVDVREIGNRNFTLTTDWKRYTMSGKFKETALNNSTTAINIGMKTRDPTVHVWIDAIQLERSRQATEYMLDGYRISTP